MAEKKKVYVEASVVSNLTSRLSKNVQDYAVQRLLALFGVDKARVALRG